MIQPKFDQHAAQYDATTPIQSEVARYLWQQILACQNSQNQGLSRHSPLIWLDVGCGTGKLSQALLNDFAENPNFQLIALDQSPAMLEQFSKWQESMRFSQFIQLIIADMTAIPLEKNSIDRLISSFALHWVSPNVITELARVAKVGGQLHLAIPVAGSLSAVKQRFPKLPIFPFLPAVDWITMIEKILQSRNGQWLYNEVQVFSHPYDNLAGLLKSLKDMGGAVSGQSPMPRPILKQYLANNSPIALDYRVLLMGFQV